MNATDDPAHAWKVFTDRGATETLQAIPAVEIYAREAS
jgi:hypothetical protein